MTKPILLKTLLWSTVLSIIITLSHHIPLNIPVLLLFLPLTIIFPQLSQTGEEVTYGFAWLEIHAPWVWVALFIWHFLVCLPITFLFFRFKKTKK
ncbi:MAG: hypothetical protein AAF959_14945 [Cyanobacteria bacterium P01_D01_bin.56]